MNQDIFPCLWFNDNAVEAAQFYCTVFGGTITVDSPVVQNIKIFDQLMMLLNGGPQFEKNASVSFMILCQNAEEVDQYWNKLKENGIVLMELGSYPWSEKYGWVRDQYGVTWQLNLSKEMMDQRLIPNLMYIHQNNGKAQEAMGLYTRVFPNSSIGNILKYGDGVGNESHEIPENVQFAHFDLNGYTFFCMDNSYPHAFNFNEGISIVVMTNSQEETDHLWNALTANGGQESWCGWLKDPYGLCWQIVPKRLLELMNDFEHPEKAQKVVHAMQGMQKISIEDLEKAYES